MLENNKHTSEEMEDLLLLKWFDKSLSEEEMAVFRARKDYQYWSHLEASTSKISVPSLDKEDFFSRINENLSEKKTEVKKLPIFKYLSLAAASVAIVFAYTFLFSGTVSINSKDAIQYSVALPDDSQVLLNTQSKLSYNEDFTVERRMKLKGEAFFEVEKGNRFIVETDYGNVTVLGTSFNVFARNGIFTVACKTGKVKVNIDEEEYELTKGKRVRIKNRKAILDDMEPIFIDSWVYGESYFQNTPLYDVVLGLSKKYMLDIDIPTSYHRRFFTGSFVHDDIEKAAKMVFVPMGVKYSISEERIHIIE